jgi:hypothetical protein
MMANATSSRGIVCTNGLSSSTLARALRDD